MWGFCLHWSYAGTQFSAYNLHFAWLWFCFIENNGNFLEKNKRGKKKGISTSNIGYLDGIHAGKHCNSHIRNGCALLTCIGKGWTYDEDEQLPMKNIKISFILAYFLLKLSAFKISNPFSKISCVSTSHCWSMTETKNRWQRIAENDGAEAFSYLSSCYLNIFIHEGIVLPLCKAASHRSRLSSLVA